MNPIALCAEEALRAHPHPVLRIDELLGLVAGRVDRGLSAERLRTVLEEYPERFRVLEPWVGPWRNGDRRAAPKDATEVWVAAIGAPDAPPDSPRPAAHLRESVRWLTRGVDARSGVEVGRWYAIVLAERAARSDDLRRAA